MFKLRARKSRRAATSRSGATRGQRSFRPEKLESRLMLSAQTEWIASSDGSLLLYGSDEFGNRLPDFSSVGYRSGTHEIPDVPVKVSIWPDGPDGDDSADIQAAIDRVAALPLDSNGYRGAVMLHAGEYELEESIEILASGIVLRGEFSGSPAAPELETVLVSAGTANHGVRPFRPFWPDEIVTARDYLADQFSHKTDFIELSGPYSLHELGVAVGEQLFFDEGSSAPVEYKVRAISDDGFAFRIEQPLQTDIQQGTFIGSAPGAHRGGLVRINPRPADGRARPMGRFTIVDEVVPVGARSFRIEPSEHKAPLQPGDTVRVVRPGSREWVAALGLPFEGDFEHPHIDGWTTYEASKMLDRTVTRVEPVEGSDFLRVTLDAPITILLDQQYGISYLSRYEWESRITDVGIEYIRGAGMPPSAELIEQYGDGTQLTRENHAWNFIAVETARDVWIRHVTGEYFANATVYVDTDATGVTVEHAQSLFPISRIAGDRRYAFESAGQKVLFRDLYSEYARHSFVTTRSKADLNVFVDSTAKFSFSESGPHIQLNTAGLFDNVIEDNAITVRHGSNGEHGLRGASQVIWNSTIDYTETVSPRLTVVTDQGEFTLIPTDDTHTSSYDSETRGRHNRLPVRKQGDLRALLMFDLSAIPDDAHLRRVELRLVPREHPLSVEGEYTHELRLLPDWDHWSEDTLNLRKDRDGVVLDDNGRSAPDGLFLADWQYRVDRDAIEIVFDANSSEDRYPLAMIRSQLFDDRLTLRIDPGDDAVGMSYYYSKDNGLKTKQPSFVVEDVRDPHDQRLIARNWLIGSSGAIDPTGLGKDSYQATPSSAEKPVTLRVDGQDYQSLYDAQLAARRANHAAYSDDDLREYWLGDTDGSEAGDQVDRVDVRADWNAKFARTRGFDSRPVNQTIPFTFDIGALEPGERIVGATLGLGLVNHLGISAGDSLHFDSRTGSNSTMVRVPFAHSELNWFRGSSLGETQTYVLDLDQIPGRRVTHSLLDELSEGYVNFAVGRFTDIDWAVLNVKVATDSGLHRDLSGDVYYLGDQHNNIVTVADGDDGLVVRDFTHRFDNKTVVPNVRRFHFYGMAGNDLFNGFDTGVSLFARGGLGDDRLIGGYGADTFEGGAGDDLLEGRLGTDRYIYDNTIFRDLGRDLVSELSAQSVGNSNELEFTGTSFANFHLGLHSRTPRFARHVGQNSPAPADPPIARTFEIWMRSWDDDPLGDEKSA